jgi:hypothetical protein
MKEHHSQGYVRDGSIAVINACEKLEATIRRASAELRIIIRGLAAAIEGYISLEREFA